MYVIERQLSQIFLLLIKDYNTFHVITLLTILRKLYMKEILKMDNYVEENLCIFMKKEESHIKCLDNLEITV